MPRNPRTIEARDALPWVLKGTLYPDCAFSKLRGNALVLENIFYWLDRGYHPSYVVRTKNAFALDNFHRNHMNVNDDPPYFSFPLTIRAMFSDFRLPESRSESLLPVPSGRDINVNMMPVNMCRLRTSVPDYLSHYIPLIETFPVHRFDVSDHHDHHDGEKDDKKKGEDGNTDDGHHCPSERIAYLTVQEGYVRVGETQRCPGLHIERPVPFGMGKLSEGFVEFKRNPTASEKIHLDISWGMGITSADDIPIDGIYMASSLPATTAVWPALLRRPEAVTDERGGDIEHLRPYLGDPVFLSAGEVCWITDRTPHECLPVTQDIVDMVCTRSNGKTANDDVPLLKRDEKTDEVYVFRQFFRLVVGPISVWHQQRNTPNPTGTSHQAPIISNGHSLYMALTNKSPLLRRFIYKEGA